MARLIATKDEATGYIYVRSGDRFRIPWDARNEIKQSGSGEYSDESHEWRVPLHRGTDVVRGLRLLGHEVIAKHADSGSPSVGGPPECASCGRPYARQGSIGPQGEEECKECGRPLILVAPPAGEGA